MSAAGDSVRLAGLAVGADPERWRAAGFAVDPDGAVRIGGVRVELRGAEAGRGLLELGLAGPAEWSGGVPDLDGLPARTVGAAGTAAATHPNGAVAVDHVVALTPDLDRTVTALERAGLDLRRIRDEPLPGGGTRQAFFRIGAAILEAIEQPRPDGSPHDRRLPARLWGLALVSADLDATCARLGSAIGLPRAAIQPGRRIATVRREAGLGTAVAFMTARAARRPGRTEGARRPID